MEPAGHPLPGAGHPPRYGERFPQGHQKGQRGHRGAEVQHRHRRPDDPDEPGDCQGQHHQGRAEGLHPAAQSLCPHVTEEVWAANALGEGLVAQQPWPQYDEAKCQDDTVEIVVQVCGKVRARLNVAADISQEDALAAAKEEPKVAAEISGKKIVKEIYVPGKLVNIVAE